MICCYSSFAIGKELLEFLYLTRKKLSDGIMDSEWVNQKFIAAQCSFQFSALIVHSLMMSSMALFGKRRCDVFLVAPTAEYPPTKLFDQDLAKLWPLRSWFLRPEKELVSLIET
jgi:hypothetical protein